MPGLPEQFRQIAARFRRINSNDPKSVQRQIDATAVLAGQCLRQACASGPSAERLKDWIQFRGAIPEPTGYLDDKEKADSLRIWYVTCWSMHSRDPVRFPSALWDEKSKGVARIRLHHNDLRQLAEDFANMADGLAEILSGESGPPDPLKDFRDSLIPSEREQWDIIVQLLRESEPCGLKQEELMSKSRSLNDQIKQLLAKAVKRKVLTSRNPGYKLAE